MSNRLYDILNTFNNLVSKDEPKKQLTESAVATPKSKLEETMAKVEADLKTFKETKTAKPDFLDADKDGDKKEPMKKAIKGKTVTEAPGQLVSGQKLGIQGTLTPFYFNAIAKYLKANGLQSVAEFGSEDIDALSSKLGVSMEALEDLVGFADEEFTEAAENPYQQRILDSDPETLAKFLETGYIDTTSDLYYNMYEYYANQMPDRVRRNMDKQYDFITAKIREVAGGVTEAVGGEDNEVTTQLPGGWTKRFSQEETGDYYLYSKGRGPESVGVAFEGAPEYGDGVIYVNDEHYDGMNYDGKTFGLTLPNGKQVDVAVNDDQTMLKVIKMLLAAPRLDESAAPGQEAWIKKNKGRFVKQYGKKKGMEVLYATAWKRSKKDESAYDAEVSKEDPVFESPSTELGDYVVYYYEDQDDIVAVLYNVSMVKAKVFTHQRLDSDAYKVRPLRPTDKIPADALVVDRRGEQTVAEGDDYWDFKDLKDEPKSRTIKVAGTRYGGSAQKDDDEETTDKPAGEKRGRGRPKGTGKKMGAKGPTGKSKLMKEATRDSLGEIAEDLQHVVDRLSDIGEVEIAKQLQPIVWDLDDRDTLDEGDYGWDYPEEKSKAPTTRKVSGTRYGGSAQKDDDEEETTTASPVKRGRGRPAGPGKKLGAKGPTGKSKLMKEGADEGVDMVKLAKVIASCTTPQQLEVAKKMAKNFLGKHRASGDDFRVSAFKNDMGREQSVKRDLDAKSRSFTTESRPSLMDRLLDETYANFGETERDLTLDQDQLRQHIGDSNFEKLSQAMQATGTYPEEMYDALFDYFSETGEMPYSAATADDEDPYQWIHQKLGQLFGDDAGGEDYGTFGDDERPEEDEMNAESVNESKDMIAESLSRILHSYPYEVKTFLAGGDMDNDLYQALVDYYHAEGEIPRQVMAGSDTMDWIADKFGTDLRNVELEEGGPKMSDVPAYLRKAQGQNFPLSRDQITPAEQHLWVVPGPGSRDFEARAFPNTPQGKMAADEFAYGVKGNVVASAENPVTETGGDTLGSELNELARLAGLKESCGDISPLTQTTQPDQASGMSINTNIDTRNGAKTMTVTADGEAADKLAEILSLSGLAGQVSSRSSEVVGQEVEQEPEMQVVAVGEEKDPRYQASTTPDPEQTSVDAIIDQGDDLNRKKKQHADKPKLGDNPMATEGVKLSRSVMRELESIKVKK